MKHLTKTLLAALFVSSMTGCGEQEEPNYSQSGEMKLNVEAALSDMAGSRAAQEDGVYFNIAAANSLDFNLSLGEQTKGMKLGENGKVTYAEGVEPFSVELIEYAVRAEGDALNAVPLSLVRGGKSYHFSSPIALNATTLTPSKAEGEAQATLNLPFKVASTGLRIDFTLYNIVPTAVTPCVGGYTNEVISLSQEDGSLFQKTGGDDVKTTYTIIIPFTAHTGTVAPGAEVAKLSVPNGGEYVIKLPTDKGIDFTSNSLYRMSVVESLKLDLETISCTVEDWNETQVSATVEGKDYEVKEDGTYYIYSTEGLKKWRNEISSKNTAVNIKLMNDVVVPEDWSPVDIFTGIFDGNGKTISGIQLTYTGADVYGGIVQKLMATGKIKDLSVVVDRIDSKGSHTGGMVGRVAENATVEGCRISGTSCEDGEFNIIGDDVSGGIIGVCVDNACVTNCHVVNIQLSTINAAGDIGAVVGEADKSTSLVACSSSNYSLKSGNRVGGIVGRLKLSTVSLKGCYSAKGKISEGKYVGGIVGQANQPGTLIACYSTGMTLSAVSGGSVNGLVGSNATSQTACFTDYNDAGVDIVGKKSDMNTALSDAQVNWEYIASNNDQFPLTIQQSLTQE